MSEKQAHRNTRAPAMLFEDNDSSSPWLPVNRQISDLDFQRFQRLMYEESGIWLSASKKALLCGRLAKRLRQLNIGSLHDYCRFVLENPDERVQMINLLCTNETHFFRERHHFDFLTSKVFPFWKAAALRGECPRRIRIWSAGCSTGEEPYSLAMLLLEHFSEGSGCEPSILATDISTTALERAQTGVWPVARKTEIPSLLLRRYMLRGTGPEEGYMRAGEAIRSLITFARLNLNDAASMGAKFDLIFCRNVLIYFGADSRKRAIQRLFDSLEPHGYLFVGHAETLTGFTDQVVTAAPTIYSLASGTVGHKTRRSLRSGS
jgi:chemotaxis protein methyltransferase CheR